MASRFSASDVAVLSREQKLEALGIALRMKSAHVRWGEGGEVMTDQECLDEAIEYELNPSVSSPQASFKLGDDWADQEVFNPYLWRSRSWLYRLWKEDPLPEDREFFPIRRAKPWTLEPEWDVPWPHKRGRPDQPLS
jgi:hypothetical protein